MLADEARLTRARALANKPRSPKPRSPKPQSPKAQSPKAQSPKAQSPKAQSAKAQSAKAQSAKSRSTARSPTGSSSSGVMARTLAGSARIGRPSGAPIDETALQQLLGYNCRRAYMAILEHAIEPIAELGLRRSWYSVLVLLHHNPGLSSRQICQTLGVQPPNLVGLVAMFEERGLIERIPDPEDARALGLYLTKDGRRLMARLEREVARAEKRATSMLSDEEREVLNRLLLRIRYSPPID